MKNIIKVIGIIALVAVMGFSLVACGGDGGNGGKTVTFSLDKVNDTGFTITVEGAKWREFTPVRPINLLVFGLIPSNATLKSAEDLENDLNNPGSNYVSIDTSGSFIYERTSDSIITASLTQSTLDDGIKIASGTISFIQGSDFLRGANNITDGGDNATYVTNPVKSSITWP